MAVEFRPADVEARRIYRTLVTGVIPRPIGWISTVDADDNDNVAPFSFFNVACVDPPMIQFAHGSRADGSLKDTARNVLETEEFVHNVVTRDVLQRMHDSSATLPADESEFDACGIERAPSKTVAPPRVADAKVSFECSLERALELGSHVLFIGEIEYVHIDDAVATEAGELDLFELDAVGRLSAGQYVELEEFLQLPPVKEEDFPKSGE